MTDVPHDDDAEAAVLSMLICDPARIGDVRDVLAPEDFYRPHHAAVFGALDELHRSGRLRASDQVTIHDALRRRAEVSHAQIADLVTRVLVWNPEHARIVARLAAARRVLGAALDIASSAREATLPGDELIDYAAETVAAIRRPDSTSTRTAGLRTFGEFVDEQTADPEPWVIPGMMRRGWRAVVVASEGAGKTVLMRQLAGAVAAGVHPLTQEQIEPRMALVVDLENPRDAIAASLARINAAASQSPNHSDALAWIESRPQGIDIRTRSGRLDLEAVLAEVRPDLLCLGPVYKLYRAGGRETDELAAGEAMDVLDDLRTRYRFALVLEHHAPKGSMSGRDILPHGTALWLRWPELGIKLTRSDAGPAGSLDVGRWRQDRVECTWPDRIDRSLRWPWVGVYRDAARRSA